MSPLVRLGLLVSCCFCISLGGRAEPPAGPGEPGIVQVPASGPPIEYQDLIIDLSRAIKSDAVAQKFRLSWHYHVLGGYGHGTILYNRTESTLKLFSDDGDSGGFPRAGYIYRGVTDAHLSDLAQLLSKPESRVMQLPVAGSVYVDTQSIIYSVQRHPQYYPLCRPLWNGHRVQITPWSPVI